MPYEQTIKNFKGGVSQQPDVLRYPDQAQEQINGWTSETTGLQKRPPARWVSRLANSGTFGAAPYIHLINRDEVEQYHVVFTGTGVRVFDLTGREYTVSGDMSYIKTSSPREKIRTVTVADYTFVVNKDVVVKRGTTKTNGGTYRPKGRAIINVRGGQYGRTLQVGINGEWTAPRELPDGKEPEHSKQMDAYTIAQNLVADIKAKFTSGAGWNAWATPEGIIVVTYTGTINKVETRDGYAGQLLNSVIDQVQTFSKLPPTAPDGYIVEILNDPASGSDSYYVKYQAATKTWKECPQWNLIEGFDTATLPHALRREANGTFSFVTLDWNKRVCGDDDSNPFPSFVDNKINDVFFFRNRLGMLSGENVILSRTGKFFNLFPSSVAALADDDPIDVAVSNNRISILKYAVPFSEELLLWSDQSQFVMRSQGVLSSKSIELDLVSEFDVSDKARPYGMGRGVYFASPRAKFTSIKRYYAVQDVSQVKDAEDISAHVPQYIPNNVFAIAGSGTESFATILTSGDPGSVYVYKFFYSESDLVIQSWSKWCFGDDVEILSAYCIGSSCYLIMQGSGSIWMDCIEFTGHTLDLPGVEPYRVYTDHKRAVKLTGSRYDINTNRTYVPRKTLWEFDFNLNRDIIIVDSEGTFYRFAPGEDIWFVGDRTKETVVVGYALEFFYEFSKFLLKTTADDGSVATETSGRLQLQKVYVNYEESGAMVAKIINHGDEFTEEMTGAVLGNSETRIGRPLIGTGTFRFSARGSAEKLRVMLLSDTPTPLNIIGGGWQGKFVKKTKGI